MIKKTILFLLLFGIFACQNVERPQKPDKLIKEARMKDILYDVALLNATRDLGRDQLERAGISSEQFVYEKYGIDSLQFAQNVTYYSVQFNKYLTMWQDVSERLEQKRDHVDSLQRRQDSIDAMDRNEPEMEEYMEEGDDYSGQLARPDDVGSDQEN